MSPVNQSEPSIPHDVLVVPKITDVTPQETIQSTLWPHINQLDLADVAPAIFTGDRIADYQHHPTAFGTVFGWVLMGLSAAMTPKSVTSMLVTSESTLEQSLSKFWEMEESPHIHHLS